MKPICAKCEMFFYPKKCGTAFVENFADQKPYKLWMGDLWECNGCGSQVISGVGQRPIAEHYEDDFADQVRSYEAKLSINSDGR